MIQIRIEPTSKIQGAITHDLGLKINKELEFISQRAIEIYLNNLPEGLKECFEKNQKYFKSQSFVSLQARPYGEVLFLSEHKLPTPEDCSKTDSLSIDLDNDIYKEIYNRYLALVKLYKEYCNLIDFIWQNALDKNIHDIVLMKYHFKKAHDIYDGNLDKKAFDGLSENDVIKKIGEDTWVATREFANKIKAKIALLI